MSVMQEIKSLEDRISAEKQSVDAEYLAFCISVVEQGDTGQLDADAIRIETIKAGRTMSDFKIDIRKLSARKKAVRVDLARVQELRGELPAMSEKLAKLKLDHNNKYTTLKVELNHSEKAIAVTREEIGQKRREAVGIETQAWRLLKDTSVDPDTSGDWRQAKLTGAPKFAPDDPRSKLPICF